MPTLKTHRLDDVTYVFLEFLRISPSYRRAQQVACGTTVRASVPEPRDFAKVQATHAKYGNVYAVYHDDWWARTGERDLPLHPSKHQRETLMQMLQLFWFIAGKREVNRRGGRISHARDIAQHRIATKLNITGVNRTKPGVRNLPPGSAQEKKRRNAGIQVNRILKRTYRIAENAARGSFPNEGALADERNKVDFRSPEVFRIIRLQQLWERRDEARLWRKQHPGEPVQYGRFDTVL